MRTFWRRRSAVIPPAIAWGDGQTSPRPVGHPPLRGEGAGQPGGDWAPSLAPLPLRVYRPETWFTHVRRHGLHSSSAFTRIGKLLGGGLCPGRSRQPCLCVLAFVQQASAPDANLSALCAQFGISRPTGYEWLAPFQEEGVAGLTERMVASPAEYRAHTAPPVEQRIVELRRQHPVWGGRGLRARLQTLGSAIRWPSASTMTAVVPTARPAGGGIHRAPDRRPVQRFTHPTPNDLWQMDFKGHLPLASRSGRCHPLTVLDDHSRFALEPAGLPQ